MRFVIPGQPVGKQRPRFAGNRAYTPKKTRDYEAHVAARARLALAEFGPLPDGPVSVWLLAVFDRPKRLLRKKDPAERMPHTMSPDIDNICKAVLDGMNGIVYEDDRLVQTIMASKVYRAKDERAHVEVFVVA